MLIQGTYTHHSHKHWIYYLKCDGVKLGSPNNSARQEKVEKKVKIYIII